MKAGKVHSGTWRRFGRLPAKIASFAAGTAGAVVLGLSYLVPALPLYAGPAAALLVGIVTYVTAHRLLIRRIELARLILREVRKHRFDNLEAARLVRGDELNALIWQVYRAGRAMEKELLSLRKMEDYRREFLGDVSHELKTPIFTIQGFTETLLNGAIDDPNVNRKFLQKILTNTRRLTNLASDLVEISRIETGELEMNRSSFSLPAVVDEVLEQLEQVARDKQVTLRREIASDLPPVLGDRARISQVLVNLVDNAIKYSNAGGDVVVRCRKKGTAAVHISVADRGIGIAPQHIPRLTERFYRIDKSRSRAQGGTGLGLAIVKHILGAHQTEMHVESRPGQGSTFSFELQAAGAKLP